MAEAEVRTPLHMRATAAHCCECDNGSLMCLQLRHSGCWICEKCLRQLANIIKQDVG